MNIFIITMIKPIII